MLPGRSRRSSWIPPAWKQPVAGTLLGWGQEAPGVTAKSATGKGPATQHRATPGNPWQAPHPSCSVGNQALENFFGVFYQSGEMHPHTHPPTTDSPSWLGANAPPLTLILLTVNPPRAPGKAEPEVQIKEHIQARSARPER